MIERLDVPAYLLRMMSSILEVTVACEPVDGVLDTVALWTPVVSL